MLAILFGALLIPTAGSAAGPRDRLRRTHSGLAVVRNRIDAQRQRALDVRERIAFLGDRITSTQIVLNGLHADLARVNSHVAEARARVRQLERAVDEVRFIAREQAVELYKSGSIDILEALLDTRSLGELGSRVDLLGVAAERNTGALVRYGRLRAAIEFHNREMFEREAQLERIRSSHAEVLGRRRRLRARLRAELARLHKDIGHDREREERLARDAGRLKKLILAAQAEHSVRVLGISSEGFIWPLNGPVTSPFGPRWGTQHTGIDIDGYTGQPVVAAKSGVVILASSSMSGYGNAVVIDHGAGISTLYGHLSGYEVRGGAVRQGEIIGYVGCTGHCFGDHLHFELRVNGNPVDPMSHLP